MKKTLYETLHNLQDGEYVYIYDPVSPKGVRRSDGELEALDPVNAYSGWRHSTGFDKFDKFIGSPFRVFKNIDEFFLEFRHDWLEPTLEEARISDGQNYRLIQEDVDEYSGQCITELYGRWQGYYFVGATSGADDFYWLYWNPAERTFKFSSCVGPIEKLDPSKTLTAEQIRNLREDIKKIHDAPFPSDLLLSPLG